MLDLMEPGASSSTSGVSFIHMEGTSCFWEKLMPKKDLTSYEPYQFIYTVTAAAAILCSLYLVNYKEKFQLRNLAYYDSYLFFTIFFIAMASRLIVPKVCNSLIGCAKPEYINCKVCALLDSFLTIFEIETLTHVCINRYVVAKYIYNGWPMNRDHIYLYMRLVFLFAFLYTIPPVFGIGDYSLDFNCKTCTLDMILPKDWTRDLVLGIWLLKSVKPAIFMIVMLIWTRNLEAKFTNAMKLRSDSFFTRIVEIVTMACLFSWAPMAIVRGLVIFSHLKGEVVLPSADLAKFAPIVYEMSPILVTLAIIVANAGMTDVQKPFEEWVRNVEEIEKKEE